MGGILGTVANPLEQIEKSKLNSAQTIDHWILTPVILTNLLFVLGSKMIMLIIITNCFRGPMMRNLFADGNGKAIYIG